MNQLFGVEIEYLGVGTSRTMAQQTLSSTGVSVADDQRTNWALKDDSSIRSDALHNCNHSSSCPGCAHARSGELVSPPLPFNEASFLQIRKLCNKIKETGGWTNDSCGLHVHVDLRFVRRWPQSTITEFFQFLIDSYAKDEEIFDSLMNEKRNSNGYCKTMKGLRYRSDNDRYRKLNLTSFTRHGTVEFRQHHGTVNGEEIIRWVKQCVTFVQDARNLFEAYHKLIDVEEIELILKMQEDAKAKKQKASQITDFLLAV